MLAERLTVSTTLDPTFEREKLQPLLDRYNEARRSGDVHVRDKAASEIHEELKPELLRRLDLINRTIALLDRDPRPVNPGVIILEKASREEHWYQYLRLETGRDDETDGPAFTPSPETDRHPAAAASRYLVHQASAEMLESALLPYDKELQAFAIASGEAVRGTITGVRDDGNGRATIPVWRVEDPSELPLKRRPGDRLCDAELPQRWGSIRSIAPRPGGGRIIEIEIQGLKTRPRGGNASTVRPAADRSHRGRHILLLPVSAEELSRRKSRRVWKKDTPGSWLTHKPPHRPDESATVDEDIED